MFQKIELRKTRDFSAKINITFEFIRQNLKPLARAMLYITGPFSILGGIFMGMYQQRALTMVADGPFAGIFSIWYLIAVIFVTLASVAGTVTALTYVRLYETKPDPENIEVAEVWEGVREDYFRVLGSMLVVGLVVGVGVIFLILPGIYLLVVLSLISAVMVIERKPFSEAFSRCFAIITEKWWSTFGLLFITAIIVGFMGYIFQIPQYIFTFLIVFHNTSNSLEEPALWKQVGMLVSSMIALVGTNLLYCIVTVALSFQFYNLVERREAQGLMNKLESFGKAESNASKNDETY